MSDRTYNQEYGDNQTIKHKEYLKKWVEKQGLQGNHKLVFISSGWGFSNTFKCTLEYAFDEFVKEHKISSYSAMIELYGDWTVYKSVDYDSKLEALGEIKYIFGW